MTANDHISGPALRLAGLVLTGCAVLAANALLGSLDAHAAGQASALDCLFALVAFAGASGGLALLVLGRHLFDEVAVSSPWVHCRGVPERRRAAAPAVASSARWSEPHAVEVHA